MTRNMRQRTDTGRSYAGATMHAAPRAHEDTLRIFRDVCTSGCPVLDVGAGSGAFSLRLRDAGWYPTALDATITPDLDGIRTIVTDIADLSDAVGPSSFPAVVSIETIEHLPNATKFLHDCYDVLQPGGTLLLTTPNVLHPYSRLKYLTKGKYWLFDESAYWSTGHITPLPEWLLREHLVRAGFTDIRWGTAGQFEASGIRRLAFRALSVLVIRRAQLPAGADGVNLVMVARKPDLPAASA